MSRRVTHERRRAARFGRYPPRPVAGVRRAPTGTLRPGVSGRVPPWTRGKQARQADSPGHVPVDVGDRRLRGVIYLFIPKDEHADPVKAVDFTVELATVRTAAPYPVAAPEGLPEKWKATSVRYDEAADKAWHLGFLDADRKYVAVEQSTAAARTYVPEVSQKAKDTGRTETVAGEEWQVWEGDKYDALVLPGRATPPW